jgi:drug/metabolite transporter (DMT)-like permease
VLAIALALGSSLAWGVADFFGGLLSRRASVAAVATLSQAAGLVPLLLLLVATGLHVDGRAFAIGLAAGACGAAGLATFYAAMSIGTISIVSPLAASSAILPAALAVAGGERPSRLALGGAALTILGATLASTHELRADQAALRRSVGIALVSACAIGGFLYLLGRAAQGGELLSALVGARSASLPLLLAWSALLRAPLAVGGRRLLLGAAGVGLLDTVANGLFALAAHEGFLSIVAVLGSQFPFATVVLAHLVLGERITRLQRMGVALTLAGVGVVSVA